MKVTLKLVLNGKVTQHSLSMGEMVSIGRSSKASLKIDDFKISSLHCRFNLKYDRLEVSDLDSKNGTYLNGIRVEVSEVFVGDQVKIGDTVITLEDSNFDSEALELLTFPGPHKERLDYELKMDFTGARIQNQQANRKVSVHHPKVNYDPNHAREIDLRKQINSKLKVSKEEIKAKHEFRAMLAIILDVAILFVILAIPYYLTKFVTADKDVKLYMFLFTEVMAAAGFILMNFRVSKFTMGEKLAGIYSIYLKQ